MGTGLLIGLYCAGIGGAGCIVMIVASLYLGFLDKFERYSDGRPTGVSVQEQEGWYPVQEHFLENPRLY